MNEKLREAFGQIQAEHELKSKTKNFIFQRTKGYTRAVNYRCLTAAFACIALLLFGVYWLYFTPTVKISIDINPSVELGVNRFNRIISFKGYNDDGRELTDSLDIKFMNYSEAVNRIIESEDIASLLSNDEIITIAVIGTDNTQSAEILSNIQSCAAGKNNTYCYYAHAEEAEKAREIGLSYGKYKAFLEARALDPDITAAEIENMTMREIRDLIDRLSGGEEDEASRSGNGKGYGPQENGNSHGEKNRRGKNRGNGKGSGQRSG